MRRMPMFPLSLLLFLPFQGLDAQAESCSESEIRAGHGAVVGTVVDAQSKIPLGFVRLSLEVSGTEAILKTQSTTSGSFRFCSVPEGTFTVRGQIGQMAGSLGPQALAPGTIQTVVLEIGASQSDEETGTLTGIVVDAETGDPIEGATVLLVDLGHEVITNSLGKFTFPSVPPGEKEIRANRLGLRETRGRVQVEIGRTVETRVQMATEAIPLDPITVTAVRRRVVLPDMEDLERRYHSGWGQFVLEEEIQLRNPRRLTDVLNTTGVNVMKGGNAIAMRRTGCAPLVYLDGVKLTRLPRGGGISGRGGWLSAPRPICRGGECESPEAEAAAAVNLVHPSAVVAIEVYRGPGETPGQFLDSNAQCGVILIWTRRGYNGGGLEKDQGVF